MFGTKIKKEIIRTSYLIGENTPIYYPHAAEENFFTDPQQGEISNYTPDIIPKNSYEKYYDKETQIAIIIFSIGRKLYIRPELSLLYPYFLMDYERQLKKMGLKEKNMNTPFSSGAIPANKDWISHYRNVKTSANVFYNSFNTDFSDDESDSEFI